MHLHLHFDSWMKKIDQKIDPQLNPQYIKLWGEKQNTGGYSL